jgi:Holliday junction resolvasome RuvABC endonuclease subunit
MIICGIDQSLTHTAVVIFDLNTEELLDFKLFKSIGKSGDKKYTPEERIFLLKNNIIEYVSNFSCSIVFIEGLSLNSNSRTMRDLAGLYYVLMTSFMELSIPAVAFPPLSVKAFAKNGRSSKEEMFEMIPDIDKDNILSSGAKKTSGLYDLSDAYFIGKLGIYKFKNENLNI